MVTQSDVAQLAGVSRRTVSYVVTGFAYVSEDARARVTAAIDALGYVPNRAAQRLRTGKSGLVALLVPEIGTGYFGEVAKLVVEEAALRGLGTVVAQTGGQRAQELQALDRILALQPDSVIISPLGLTVDDIAHIRTRCPVALIGEHFVGEEETCAIDNEVAAAAMVTHLVDSGRQHIAVVGMTAPPPRFAVLRRDGYQHALDAAGLTPHEFATDGFDHADGYRAGETIAAAIRAGVASDALFCGTDGIALGATRALHDAGLRAPEDVAVAGFDDIVEGRYANPRLSTVAPDKRQIARRALAAALHDTPPELPRFELAIRESTGR